MVRDLHPAFGVAGRYRHSQETDRRLKRARERAMAAAEQEKAEQIKHETFDEHINQIQYDAQTFDGKAFQEKFLAENALKEHDSVVIALMKTEEIEYIVEEILAKREAVYIEDRGVYYYIEGDKQIEIDFDDVAEGLGRSYTVYDFLVNLSTT